MNVGDWGGLAIGFSLWGNGLGLDRAGRYLYPFFPPAQQPGEGRDDQAERLRRAAILIAPLPTPGPLPVKATRRSFPHTREASSGPSPDREPPGRVRDGSAAGGACRGKRGAITTPKRPTIMPGGPLLFLLRVRILLLPNMISANATTPSATGLVMNSSTWPPCGICRTAPPTI